MKLKKKIIVTIASAMLLAASLCVTANAKTGTSGYLTYSSYQYSAHRWNISSSSSISCLALTCSGTGSYYTSTAKTTSNVSCGNGGTSTPVSAYMTNNNGYGWQKCVSRHTMTETDGSVLTKSSWTVEGTYVY